MARLRVGEVHAIQKHKHLVERTSTHRNVALNIIDTAGAEVDAGDKCQHIAD